MFYTAYQAWIRFGQLITLGSRAFFRVYDLFGMFELFCLISDLQNHSVLQTCSTDLQYCVVFMFKSYVTIFKFDRHYCMLFSSSDEIHTGNCEIVLQQRN